MPSASRLPARCSALTTYSSVPRPMPIELCAALANLPYICPKLSTSSSSSSSPASPMAMRLTLGVDLCFWNSTSAALLQGPCLLYPYFLGSHM